MSESGFDVLKDFQPEGGSITFEPYKPFEETQNIVDYNTEKQAKNEISAEAAAQMVQDTNTFNYYANMYAGQLLPVQQQQKLNMDAYAQALGLGKRYSPDEFKAIIEQAVGPIEDTTAGRKFTRFMVDMFNARTPYKGTAGALDVYLQSLGKKFEREDVLKAQKLERRLMIGELAAKQAADANAAMKAVEADYYAKMMGYDNQTAQKHLGFTGDLIQKIAQTNFDIQEKRVQAGIDLMKNPKMPVNIGYTNEQGDFVGPVAAMPVLTPGGIQIKLGRKDDESGNIIYDVDLPTANFRLMPKEGAEAEAKAAKASTLSQAKIREGSSNLFTLQNQFNDVQSILNIAYQDPSKVGVSGSIKKAFQEFGATTAAIFDLLGQEQGKGAIGTNLANDGQMMYSYDQANPGAIPTGGTVDTTIQDDIILRDLPGKLPFQKETKVVKASIDDITKTSWWESQGYDPTYAQNKVKEIFIIYGLARALKSTGRLNVDDIQRASEAVSIYGIQSPQAAIAKLEQVAQKLSDAQKAIIRSTPEVLGTNPEVNEVIIPMLERLQLPVDVYQQYFMTPISPQGDTVREVEGAIPTTIEEAGSLQSPPANTGQSMSINELFLGSEL
tara:strand:- start:344 stop:2179 length:1836 start_codon:yes stop_codon:yes gene_type:complete